MAIRPRRSACSSADTTVYMYTYATAILSCRPQRFAGTPHDHDASHPNVLAVPSARHVCKAGAGGGTTRADARVAAGKARRHHLGRSDDGMAHDRMAVAPPAAGAAQ